MHYNEKKTLVSNRSIYPKIDLLLILIFVKGFLFMSKRNDKLQRYERQRRADLRREAREARLNDEQIAVILARGGNPTCSEIKKLQDEKPVATIREAWSNKN